MTPANAQGDHAPSPLSPNQRRILGLVADVLIPASEGMPSAQEAGATGKWLDRVLSRRPGSSTALSTALDGLSGADPATELEELEARSPEDLRLIQWTVLAAYHMSPRVRKLLGYSGQRPHPVLADEAEYYLSEDLIAPVRAAGRRYRPTPPEMAPDTSVNGTPQASSSA